MALTPSERTAALAQLPNWTFYPEPERIERRFKFKSFVEAFAFMTKAAFAAEKLGHHPDWSNSYNTVSVVLTTHDVGGLTEKDIALAQAMDGL